MPKKNKKSKIPDDFGAQQLIKTKDSKLVRQVDGEEFFIAFTREGRHLEKAIKSILENYYVHNQLDPKDRDINSRRYLAGQKFEGLAHRSGMNQRITTRLAEVMIGGGNDDFLNDTIDFHSDLHQALKFCNNEWRIVWQVIVDNKPARKKMDQFREGLDNLIIFFDL